MDKKIVKKNALFQIVAMTKYQIIDVATGRAKVEVYDLGAAKKIFNAEAKAIKEALKQIKKEKKK